MTDFYLSVDATTTPRFTAIEDPTLLSRSRIADQVLLRVASAKFLERKLPN